MPGFLIIEVYHVNTLNIRKVKNLCKKRLVKV